MEDPLTSDAASEASHKSTSAMDPGFTHFEKSADGSEARLAGVSITLGRTTLAVMPEFFTSSATERTSMISAAFDTA